MYLEQLYSMMFTVISVFAVMVLYDKAVSLIPESKPAFIVSPEKGREEVVPKPKKFTHILVL